MSNAELQTHAFVRCDIPLLCGECGLPMEAHAPCPDCELEAKMLREVGVLDEAILKVPVRGTCGHEPEVQKEIPDAD